MPQSAAQVCRETQTHAPQPHAPTRAAFAQVPVPLYTCDQVEEEPRPPRLRKTSKILLEAIGGTCQVEPEEKGLLGARAEETKAEEPKVACGSPVFVEVQIQKRPDAKVSAPCTVSTTEV